MKVLVAGSREIPEYTFWRLARDSKILQQATEIISGGARGVDRCGELFAAQNNIPCTVIKPDWDRFQRAAGMIRNTELASGCDAAFIIWDWESKGTQDTINKLKIASKPREVWIVGYNA